MIKYAPEEIRRRAAALGPWFHNIDLAGVATAPEHFLGDYPAIKWRRFAHALPADLSGRTVLDIGCNGGFYAIEMKRRNAARVLAIDIDEDYLRQARFATDVIGLDIEFAHMSVYDVASLERALRSRAVFGCALSSASSLVGARSDPRPCRPRPVCLPIDERGDPTEARLEGDYPFQETAIFERPDFPRLAFIEHCYAGDDTNWWIPNRACTAAMLRSAGFVIDSNPEEEVFICRPGPAASQRVVYPARPKGRGNGAVP